MNKVMNSNLLRFGDQRGSYGKKKKKHHKNIKKNQKKKSMRSESKKKNRTKIFDLQK